MIIPALLIAVLLMWVFRKKQPVYTNIAEDTDRLINLYFPPPPPTFIYKSPDGNMIVMNEQELSNLKNDAKAAAGRLIDEYLELYHQGKITKKECEKGMNEVLDSFPPQKIFTL